MCILQWNYPECLSIPVAEADRDIDMLMRPYLIKIGGKRQLNRYEEEAARAEAEAKARAKVKITPNDLRGLTKSPYDSDGESEDEDDGVEEFTGPRWGERKKKQQKKLIKQLEKRLQETKEEQEDKDIEEFLIKE